MLNNKYNHFYYQFSPTNIVECHVPLGILVERPRCPAVALYQRDTSRHLDVHTLVEGHVATEQEGGNTAGHGRGVYLKTSQQMLDWGDHPELWVNKTAKK